MVCGTRYGSEEGDGAVVGLSEVAPLLVLLETIVALVCQRRLLDVVHSCGVRTALSGQ